MKKVICNEKRKKFRIDKGNKKIYQKKLKFATDNLKCTVFGIFVVKYNLISKRRTNEY